MVHLEPADFRQVVPLGAEEHVMDKGFRKLIRGRVARSQLPVYLEERFVLAACLVDKERVAKRES